MTIDNVSGNIQPTTEIRGNSLPTTNVVKQAKNGAIQADSKVASFNQKSAPNAPRANVRQVSEAIQQDASFTQNIARRLQFKVDEEVGVTVVKVYDRETDELIRQFPPEELLNLSKRLKALNEDQSSSSGVLLQEKV